MIYSINMKKLACIVSLLLTAAAVLAQTPQQILTRMEEEMGKLGIPIIRVETDYNEEDVENAGLEAIQP